MNKDWREKVADGLKGYYNGYITDEEFIEVVGQLLKEEREKTLELVKKLRLEANMHPMQGTEGDMAEWNAGYDYAMSTIIDSLSTSQKQD